MGVLTGGRERRSGVVPWSGEPPIPAYPGAATSGSTGVSSMAQALTLPAVWQCVNLVANTMSVMPLETFRRTAGVPQRVDDPALVTAPASGHTQSTWIHQVMLSLLLRGNAVGIKTGLDDNGRPSQIELLNPDQVTARVNAQGSIDWTAGGSPVPSSLIWHVAGMTLPGMKIGVAPISAGAMTFGIDLASRQFAADYFAGGGIPKAVMMADGEITQTEARTIKDRLLTASRSREPIVLGSGVEYKAIQVSPEEAQFLSTQQLSIAQIARFFLVPPKMVGGTDGTSLTYANVEQLQLDFLTQCIAFWMKRIEDAFFPLLPGQQFVKFNEKSLLRLDAETQAKVYVQYVAGKIVAPSEIRDELGRPPATEAQKTEMDLVPLTITPLGGAKALPNPTPPGPEAQVPADDQQGASSAA